MESCIAPSCPLHKREIIVNHNGTDQILEQLHSISETELKAFTKFFMVFVAYQKAFETSILVDALIASTNMCYTQYSSFGSTCNLVITSL